MGLFDLFKGKVVEEKPQRLSDEELRLQKREEEKRKSLEIKNRHIQEYEEALSAIPKWDIKISDNFVVNEDREDEEIKFSSLTAKTNKEKLSHFVVIDTETTGLKSSSGVLELSGIRFDNFEPTMQFDTFIKPKSKSWTKAEEINHISPEMVANSPTLEQVAQSFIEFVGDYNIVGHNLEFDLDILEDKGITFGTKRKYYDTLPIAQKHLKKPKVKWNKEDEMYEEDLDGDFDVFDHKLETLCDHYGIVRKDAHMSNSDCYADGLVYIEMINEIVD